MLTKQLNNAKSKHCQSIVLELNWMKLRGPTHTSRADHGGGLPNISAIQQTVFDLVFFWKPCLHFRKTLKSL